MGLLLDMYVKNLVWFHLFGYKSATVYVHVKSVRGIEVNMRGQSGACQTSFVEL